MEPGSALAKESKRGLLTFQNCCGAIDLTADAFDCDGSKSDLFGDFVPVVQLDSLSNTRKSFGPIARVEARCIDGMPEPWPPR